MAQNATDRRRLECAVTWCDHTHPTGFYDTDHWLDVDELAATGSTPVRRDDGMIFPAVIVTLARETTDAPDLVHVSIQEPADRWAAAYLTVAEAERLRDAINVALSKLLAGDR